MAMLSFLATRQRVSRRNAKAVDDASFLPRHELPTLAARDGSLTIPAALRRLGWNHRILTYDDFLLAVAEEAAELVVQPFPDILGETQYLRGNRKQIGRASCRERV